jgi:hypothetical protein
MFANACGFRPFLVLLVYLQFMLRYRSFACLYLKVEGGNGFEKEYFTFAWIKGRPCFTTSSSNDICQRHKDSNRERYVS